jgi:hypothetical protein
MPAPNGQAPIQGRSITGPLARADHVGEQEDGDERRHHIVEMAQRPPRQRRRVDRLDLVSAHRSSLAGAGAVGQPQSLIGG